MTKKLSIDKPNAANRLSVAWPPFADKLTGVLARLEEDQYLIVSVKGSNRFVQFAAQGSFGMRVETTSNSYLPKPEQLNKRQVATLIDAGWQDPTGDPEESTPENDPDGSSNFFVEFARPVAFGAVAQLTVRTFAQILRVPYPSSLQYEAFESEGRSLALPELGLKLAQRAPNPDSQEDLAQHLLATLKECTGVSDLDYDEDRDIGIRHGSALTWVRLLGDPPFVRFYSRILHDVEDNGAIVSRLNDINARQPMVHFVFRGDAIFALADTCAAPFVAAHVAHALVHFCAIVDGMDRLLQAEFGGETTFVMPAASSLRH